jgi:hypothetical protein
MKENTEIYFDDELQSFFNNVKNELNDYKNDVKHKYSRKTGKKIEECTDEELQLFVQNKEHI